MDIVFRHPGVTTLLMTLWWVLPMFIVKVIGHPFLLHMPSHLLYAAIVLLSIGSAVILNGVNKSTNIWVHSTDWGRYHIICAAYTVQMLVTLVVVRVLDVLHLVGYYGGAPENGAEILFVPSALLYFMLGEFFKCGSSVNKWRKERAGKERAVMQDNTDKRRRDRGSIHIIFLIKFMLLILGAWIVYNSWQAGTLEEDMTRYANDIMNAGKTYFEQASSHSERPTHP